MPRTSLGLLCLLVVLLGCDNPWRTTKGVSKESITLYDGVYFRGVDYYNGVTIIPDRLTAPVKLCFPDGTVESPDKLTAEFLTARGIVFKDSGPVAGNDHSFVQQENGSLQVSIKNNRVTRVFLIHWGPGQEPISIEVRGKRISIPLNRDEMEAQLGKPDAVHIRTSPDEEYHEWLAKKKKG